MMRHLLLIKNVGGAFVPRLRNWASQLRDNLPPICFSNCDNFIGAGMLLASRIQVKCVEGLIDNRCVRPIPPRSHHRRRDISRARPHGDANWNVGARHSLKIKLHRVDCGMQSFPGFSEAACVATVGSSGLVHRFLSEIRRRWEPNGNAVANFI